MAEKVKRLEGIKIDFEIDFSALLSISTEGRQKLKRHKPATIGQASRISGYFAKRYQCSSSIFGSLRHLNVPRGTFWFKKWQKSPIFRKLVNKLPGKPGVYQFINATGDLIYIGKAKNLKKRVTSYFTQSDQHSYKHDALVRQIHDIQYILVDDESDALLLENNLIKENLPKYNIMLKDDKTYPWIVITNERFPRVMLTRNYISGWLHLFWTVYLCGDGPDHVGSDSSTLQTENV